MPIHRQRLISGLLFIVIGLVFGCGAALKYPIGTAAQMGPGYFPLLLSLVLLLLGGGICLQGLRLRRHFEAAQESVLLYQWRPVLFVLLANVVFGLLLKGTPWLGIPAQGLIVSIYAIVMIASLADRENQWRQSLVLATILAAGCYFIFIRGMGLPVPAWPSYWPSYL